MQLRTAGFASLWYVVISVWETSATSAFPIRFREKNSTTPIRNFSARLEEQDGHLAQVEVNEMLCLVGDVAAEVPPDDAVPGGVILLVKLLKKVKRRRFVKTKSKSRTNGCKLKIQHFYFHYSRNKSASYVLEIKKKS